MNIDAAQFTKIVDTVYERFAPGYRDSGGGLTPAEAELVVAIAQLAVVADRVEDRDELALFDQLAGHVYAHARIATTPPTLEPVEDDDQRLDQLRTHAAQLQGKAAGALAYSIAYILTISDMDLDPDEGEILDVLREALGLDEEQADDLLPAVSELLAPEE